MDAPDTEHLLRLLKEKKLKNNFIGKKSLIFLSKLLFDLKVKGFQGKILAAM
jgi:HKD family nuclease